MDNLYDLKVAYSDVEKNAENLYLFFSGCDASWKDNVSEAFKQYAKSASDSIYSLKTIVDNLSSIDEMDSTVNVAEVKNIVSKIESRCN